MFGFFKASCEDKDLYGYLIQAIGAVHNNGEQLSEGRFPHEQIVYIVDLMLADKSKKIDERQRRLVKFAAELADQYSSLNSQNDIKRYVEHFGVMMKRGWDFRDPSVELFKNRISNFGCTFQF
jgi:hypothetical protein